MNRFLAIFGLSALLTAAVLFAASRLGLPVGHLPGDIHHQGERGSFWFPLTTSVLASVLWSLFASLLARWWR